jgi:hypothetical protein
VKPKDVPAGFVDLAVEVFEDQAHEHCSEEDGCPGNTRPYHEALVRESLAEILPEHEKQVRAKVVADLTAERQKVGDNEGATLEIDRLIGATCRGLSVAIEIARGGVVKRGKALVRRTPLRTSREKRTGRRDTGSAS